MTFWHIGDTTWRKSLKNKKNFTVVNKKYMMCIEINRKTLR